MLTKKTTTEEKYSDTGVLLSRTIVVEEFTNDSAVYASTNEVQAPSTRQPIVVPQEDSPQAYKAVSPPVKPPVAKSAISVETETATKPAGRSLLERVRLARPNIGAPTLTAPTAPAASTVTTTTQFADYDTAEVVVESVEEDAATTASDDIFAATVSSVDESFFM